MRSTRAILSVQVTGAGSRAGAAVNGFLAYVQHRDHANQERDGGLAGLVRYVAHRDAASPEGRLFDRERTVGAAERKELVKYVRNSLANRPETSREGRAVYRMVLSPEDSRGLDLRQLARATMSQLERDANAPLPPWIAAEHRNTAHPHVHIVMAARREVEPGRFREVRITKPRLARMKLAMSFELESQRDARAPHRSLEERLLEAAAPRPRSERQRSISQRGWFRRSPMQRFLLRLAAQQRRETERLEREIERERRERGWER
jgi:type IV secretory pathway VirD2 relaxase